MAIPVILKDGRECEVDKDRLQFLLATEQILYFRRATGWVVVGRDRMRRPRQPIFNGKERRQPSIFPREKWY